MNTLALKLILTPALIGAASLAGRRWGPAISGWLVGLPLTSGPIAFILAVTHGASFATATATGILAGATSPALFALVYAWVARRYAWPATLAAALATYVAITVALQLALSARPLGLVPLYLLVVALLALMLLLMPRPSAMPSALPSAMPSTPPATAKPSALPWWDLPARMLLATAFVLLLTGAAAQLGPQLTGLLAPFPLYASILAVFAHQQQGALAAVNVLRGLLLGMFSFASFFLTLGLLLVPAGIPIAFTAAIAVALALQAAALWVLRHPRRPAFRTTSPTT